MGFHGGGWWAFIRYDEDQDQPKVTRALLRRVWWYARQHTGRIVAILATVVGISSFSLIPPLLIRDLIDNALPAGDVTRLNLLVVGMISVPLVNGLLGIVQRQASARIGEGIIFNLRRDVYDHMQCMSLRFFTNTQVGELMSRLNNDVVGAQRAVTGTLVTLLSNTISLVATLAIMLTLEWRLTLLGVAILPLFILPARRIGETLRRITRHGMELNARMNALMNETLNVSGALLVKLFGRRKMEVDRFGEIAAAVRDVGVRRAVIGQWFFLGLSVVSAVGTAIVFWAGGHLVLRGAFSIGTIVAFGTYLAQLYGPLMALTNARVEFATSMVSFERVFEVLDLPLEIQESSEPVLLVETRGHVRFENVSFSYREDSSARPGLEEVPRFGMSMSGFIPPVRKVDSEKKDGSEAAMKGRWALHDVSFEVKPGEMVALVGPSGAGKTTVTYMLPRLYDPTQGRVTLDGHDLRDLSLESLANHVGMVTQETFLFNTSIRENLSYAKLDASQDELEEACRAANIHDFISALPEGYDTIVGERGYRLSGGEKQRVAIARAILKDPQVLVLDEATSHLDSQSESLIQEAMEIVMSGRTSLVIAHRLSTVTGADRILVLENGRLVEQGRHDELVAQGGLYSELYQTQFQISRQAV